jgi:ABC-type branched-subunit amino acid transport system substrate-binding protein
VFATTEYTANRSASTNEPADEPTVITIGALLPLTGRVADGGARTMAGALALAVEDVNSHPDLLRGKRLEYVFADDSCSASVGLLAASTMLAPQKRRISALIGPACSDGCETTGFLTKSLNAPQIAFSCVSPLMSDKVRYPTFVRTIGPYGVMMPGIVALMKWANWTKISSIASTANVDSWAADLLRQAVVGASMSLEVDIRFSPGRFEAADLQRIAIGRLRVVFVLGLAADVAKIALAAHDSGMTNAGWAWIGVNVPGAEYANTSQIDIAKVSLDGWLYIEPTTAAPPQFFDMVRNRSSLFNVSYRANEKTHVFAASLYDAVILFAHAATVMIDRNESLGDGRSVVAAMMNVSFDGMTGWVQLDKNGDLRSSTRVMNYILIPSIGMKSVAVARFDAKTQRFVTVDSSPSIRSTDAFSKIQWPGRSQDTPVDRVAPPQCKPGSSWTDGAASACKLCVPGIDYVTPLLVLAACRVHSCHVSL